MNRLTAFPLLLLLLTACGPVRSTIGLVDAQRALQQAQDAGGMEKAPYQTAMAEELLDKAHDAQGRSTYDDSMYLAQESMTWAEKALEIALGRAPNNAPAPLPDPGPIPVENKESEPTPGAEPMATEPAAAAEPTPEESAEPTPEPAPEDPWGTGGED